jgi:hypothetical protein
MEIAGLDHVQIAIPADGLAVARAELEREGFPTRDAGAGFSER